MTAQSHDPGTADRAALRDRIAEALYLVNPVPGASWEQVGSWDRTRFRKRADAVLAVLPEQPDRAAVYAEVADRLAVDAEQGDKEGLTRIYRRSAAKQVREWSEELRCMADETQQQPTERCAHCAHPKSDHDGRTDHRAHHSPLVAGEPWCHACDSACDYAATRHKGTT